MRTSSADDVATVGDMYVLHNVRSRLFLFIFLILKVVKQRLDLLEVVGMAHLREPIPSDFISKHIVDLKEVGDKYKFGLSKCYRIFCRNCKVDCNEVYEKQDPNPNGITFYYEVDKKDVDDIYKYFAETLTNTFVNQSFTNIGFHKGFLIVVDTFPCDDIFFGSNAKRWEG